MNQEPCRILILRHGPWHLVVTDDGACFLEPPRDQHIVATNLPTHEDLIKTIEDWEALASAKDLQGIGPHYMAAVHRFKEACRWKAIAAIADSRYRRQNFLIRNLRVFAHGIRRWKERRAWGLGKKR